MLTFRNIIISVFLVGLSGCAMGNLFSDSDDPAVNTNPPVDTVRINFTHHSTGSDWIASWKGHLGTELNNNNFYVSETDYGWSDPGYDIGSHTDTTDWPTWFTDSIMPHVYANTSHYDYTNVISSPGGENEIIMFKSCYPNSEVGSSISDEKGIYNGLLSYFSAHRDKMFVLVIPPPEIEISSAALTRELSNWLADRENGWLSAYAYDNVYAFDYYNVLTDPNNHHRIGSDGTEEHIVSDSPVDAAHPDELYYYTGSDSHPLAAGQQKATEEFLPLLNSWYNSWKE